MLKHQSTHAASRRAGLGEPDVYREALSAKASSDREGNQAMRWCRNDGHRFHVAVACAAVWLLYGSVACAHDAVIIGAGGKPCARWTEARAKDNGPQYAGWLLGFVSAENVYALRVSTNVAGGIDPGQLLAWMDLYCRDRPDTPIYRATIELINELRKQTGAE
jgi:hypothetical protein